MVKTSKSKFGLERGDAVEALKAFLDETNEAKVFALKGEWGIGKTALVKNFLLANKKEHYYSSVFGISSVDELKSRLIANYQAVRKEDRKVRWFEYEGIAKKKELEDASRLINSKNIEKIVEQIPYIGKLGGGITASVFSLIGNAVINKMLAGQLICIDDLERKSKKLELHELLGLVESLVEDQKCKIILIYNESEIGEEDKKTLSAYREKVIDIEIRLDPNANENFLIGFGKDYLDESTVFDYLTKEYIQTNNIRVIKKLRWTLEKLKPCINDLLPIIRHQIIEETIFILLSKYDNKFPFNLDELPNSENFLKLASGGEEEDRKRYLAAIDLGYSSSLISDELVHLVETSVINCNKFFELCNQLNDREINNNIRKKLHEAYAPYSSSFSSSEEQLRTNLTYFLDENCLSLDLRELQELKEISNAIDLDLTSYKKAWLRHQLNSPDVLKSLDSFQVILQEYPDLILEYKEKIKSLEQAMSITQILTQSRKAQFLTNEEAAYLNRLTVEDYKKWLLEDHPDQYFMVKWGLKMGEQCSQTLKEAISELAHASKLNLMRAKNLYNIDIENQRSLEE